MGQIGREYWNFSWRSENSKFNQHVSETPDPFCLRQLNQTVFNAYSSLVNNRQGFGLVDTSTYCNTIIIIPRVTDIQHGLYKLLSLCVCEFSAVQLNESGWAFTAIQGESVPSYWPLCRWVNGNWPLFMSFCDQFRTSKSIIIETMPLIRRGSELNLDRIHCKYCMVNLCKVNFITLTRLCHWMLVSRTWYIHPLW